MLVFVTSVIQVGFSDIPVKRIDSLYVSAVQDCLPYPGLDFVYIQLMRM